MITVEIENVKRNGLDGELASCANQLRNANPQMRETAAVIIKNWGFKFHIGGRHVAIINPVSNERLAVVTNNVDTDWN